MRLQTTHLQKELGDLRLTVLEMAAMVEKALARSLRSIGERNTSLAEEIIESDGRINDLQYRVDETCLRLLALEQPVARDLRFIMGCTAIAANLERIGDEAVNIAERTLLLAQKPEMDSNPSLDELATAAREMLAQVIQAFNKDDTEAAKLVCTLDDRADNLYVRNLKHYIDAMIQESRLVERAVHLIMMSKSLERVGDLCTNIAENIIFIVKGVDIRQHGDSL